MSVHDDGPPSWRNPPTPAPTPAPAPSDPDKPTAEWVSPIEVEALSLLKELIEKHENITSLDFKTELRVRCASMEPAPKIVQDDVSKFLKRWFLNVGVWGGVGGGGEESGYAFREHKTDAGKTFNEYFYDPKLAGRQEEKQLEEKIIEAQLSGDAPKTSKGLLAWIRGLFK